MPQTFECPICTDECSAERMVRCEGRTTHYYCYDCAKEYAKNIIGSMKAVVACCSGDCKAELSKKQLMAILEPSLVNRLELNVQNEVLRMAGIEDLSDCPFCDFKAILPTLSEEPLFRCQNFDKCGRASCRRCNKAAHPGLPCRIADRTKLSEAENSNKALLEKLRAELATTLSDALICRCNNCKQPFVKSVGCNEMKCQQCSHVQCYVCGESLTNPMDHYRNGKPCKMFDNTADLEDKRVKQAKATFLENVKSRYPSIKGSDLEIKMSKTVEEMEQARLKAWQHPENLIPTEEIEGENFENRNPQTSFRFSTTFDKFPAEDTTFEDSFGDVTFGFGMIFEQLPFPGPQEVTEAYSRLMPGAARPGSERVWRTARPAVVMTSTRMGTSRQGNIRASTSHLGNTADSHFTLARDITNFPGTSRPVAANTLTRTAGDSGASSSSTTTTTVATNKIQRNANAGSSRAQSRVTIGSNRQSNDVAASRSRPPATNVASSSRTVSVEAPANLSQVAARGRAVSNKSQRSVSTTPTRLRPTTMQSSPAILNSARTGVGSIGPNRLMTRISRTSRGNPIHQSNTERLDSMARSSMFGNDLHHTRVYRRGSSQVPLYGYNYENGFEIYEDPYYHDYDEPYEYGYYGRRRQY